MSVLCCVVLSLSHCQCISVEHDRIWFGLFCDAWLSEKAGRLLSYLVWFILCIALHCELNMIWVAVHHLVSKSCSMLCAKMHACNHAYILYKLPMMMKSDGQKFVEHTAVIP